MTHQAPGSFWWISLFSLFRHQFIISSVWTKPRLQASVALVTDDPWSSSRTTSLAGTLEHAHTQDPPGCFGFQPLMVWQLFLRLMINGVLAYKSAATFQDGALKASSNHSRTRYMSLFAYESSATFQSVAASAFDVREEYLIGQVCRPLKWRYSMLWASCAAAAAATCYCYCCWYYCCCAAGLAAALL